MKPDQLLESFEQSLEENLRDWFKEKWVRFNPQGKIMGPCARGDDSEGKPKCLPQKKAHALGKKGRASAASRKRREDPNPERKGKAINVATKKKTNESVAEAINMDITNPRFHHEQQIGDYLYKAKYKPTGLLINAYDRNKEIGEADLIYSPAYPKGNGKKFWLESEWTWVDENYRRQGIMTTMYAYAKMLGNSVKPSWDQSEEAKAAWSNWEKSGDAKHLMREQGVAEEQIEELKCWDGYRRVSGKRPGSPGSCTKVAAESMDGVSPGTHMFTSEENQPARRGTVAAYGPAGRVGMLNKERIRLAASFVTKQPNHPQNQAKLYMPDAESPKGIREVAVLSTEDTKVVDRFLKAFFRNPELNRVHPWLYNFLSYPGKIQELARQLTANPKYTEIIQVIREPEHIKAFLNVMDQMSGVSEALNPSNTQSANKTKRVFMVIDNVTKTNKFRFDDEAQARQAVQALNRDVGYDRYEIKSMEYPVSTHRYYEQEQLDEKWSEKYKRSINCSNPKGFSQRAHCQGRKKK